METKAFARLSEDEFVEVAVILPARQIWIYDYYQC